MQHHHESTSLLFCFRTVERLVPADPSLGQRCGHCLDEASLPHSRRTGCSKTEDDSNGILSDHCMLNPPALHVPDLLIIAEHHLHPHILQDDCIQIGAAGWLYHAEYCAMKFKLNFTVKTNV